MPWPRDFCDADSCLVESLADFVFALSLFFKWVEKFVI